METQEWELQHLSSPGGEGGGSREGQKNGGDAPTLARREEEGGKSGREEAEETGEGGTEGHGATCSSCVTSWLGKPPVAVP